MWPNVSLILGGAASGKSDFAERLALSAGLPSIYLATAQQGDAEMSARIARHRQARDPRWQTQETPLDVAAWLRQARGSSVVLLDCATLWLSNHMANGSDMSAEQDSLMSALDACLANVVVVSNEVGQGIVPDNQLARQFRDLQGQLNQRLGAKSQLVVMVTAGLPQVLKGALPEGGA